MKSFKLLTVNILGAFGEENPRIFSRFEKFSLQKYKQLEGSSLKTYKTSCTVKI